MPTSIPYTVTGPTCAFLRQISKWNDVKLAGLLARSPLEPQTEQGVYSVTWSNITAQEIADDLWKLREREGPDITERGMTLGQVIEAWDAIILADSSRLGGQAGA